MNRRKWSIGLLCLLVLALACGAAGALEDADILRQAEAMVAAWGEERPFMADPPPVVRSVYQITFPLGFAGLSESAQKKMEENYGGYDMVICVEMGIQQVPPLLNGFFLAVGVKADGSFEECATPQQMSSILYEYGILEGAEVRQLVE